MKTLQHLGTKCRVQITTLLIFEASILFRRPIMSGDPSLKVIIVVVSSTGGRDDVKRKCVWDDAGQMGGCNVSYHSEINHNTRLNIPYSNFN